MNVIPYFYKNQIRAALTVSPEILLCISGIFCHKSKAKTGKEGRDAIEGVLMDSYSVILKESKKQLTNPNICFILYTEQMSLSKGESTYGKR